MQTISFAIDDPCSPQLLLTQENYLLLYKPPKMHSVPGKGASLVEWCAALFPEILEIRRSSKQQAGSAGGDIANTSIDENGFLFRLDYETNGIILCARNQDYFQKLFEEQQNDKLLKFYGAIVSENHEVKPGFPPFEEEAFFLKADKPYQIKCFFRPYGPDRKEVRPVAENAGLGFGLGARKENSGRLYTTEILENRPGEAADMRYLRVRINRGFRHQIRCHLAWAGCPVINDPVYGGAKKGREILGLRAEGIEFIDPDTGRKMRYILPEIEMEDL